jgi:hypothetical protein
VQNGAAPHPTQGWRLASAFAARVAFSLGRPSLWEGVATNLTLWGLSLSDCVRSCPRFIILPSTQYRLHHHHSPMSCGLTVWAQLMSNPSPHRHAAPVLAAVAT